MVNNTVCIPSMNVYCPIAYPMSILHIARPLIYNMRKAISKMQHCVKESFDKLYL